MTLKKAQNSRLVQPGQYQMAWCALLEPSLKNLLLSPRSIPSSTSCPFFMPCLPPFHMEILWPFMVYQIVLYCISDISKLIKKNQTQAYYSRRQQTLRAEHFCQIQEKHCTAFTFLAAFLNFPQGTDFFSMCSVLPQSLHSKRLTWDFKLASQNREQNSTKRWQLSHSIEKKRNWWEETGLKQSSHLLSKALKNWGVVFSASPCQHCVIKMRRHWAIVANSIIFVGFVPITPQINNIDIQNSWKRWLTFVKKGVFSGKQGA